MTNAPVEKGSEPAPHRLPIRIGLIGASADPARTWGSRAHIPAIRHLPQFELAAVCTSNERTAAEAARQFGVAQAFADARRMAASPEVDVVVVSVRTPLHQELVAAALQARKPVYCEWPLGSSLEQARRMLADTRSAGVANMIGMQGRYNEAIAHARDLIAEGFIGRMVAVSVDVLRTNYGPEESRENAYLADAANGATLLEIGAAQALEAVCACVGDLREASVLLSNQHPTCQIIGTDRMMPKSAPDQVLLQGELEIGAVFTLRARGGASPATTGSRIEINGTKGDLVLSAPGGNLHWVPLGVAGARRGERALRPLPLPTRYQLQPAGLPEGPARYLAHNYLALAESLQGGKPIANDFAYAVRWHERLALLQRAAASGTRVALPALQAS